MNKKALILVIVVCLLVVIFYDRGVPEEEADIRIACNDDAAGILIQYIAETQLANVKAVNMTYQQLQDCCGSQTDLALTTNGYDLAVLCPDSAARLIEEDQPYVELGAVIYNANVLVNLWENQDLDNFSTIGYMNLREIQIQMLRKILGEDPELQPMIPSALPYALERGAVEAVVLDILSALRMDAQFSPLEYERPTAVLVVHEKFLQSPLFDLFLEAYNKSVTDLRDPDTLKAVLENYYKKQNCENEVEAWQKMKTSYQFIQRERP